MEDTLRLGIDSTGAAAGAAKFDEAIDKIAKSIARLDTASSTGLGRVTNSVRDLAEAAKGLSALSNLRISASSVKNMKDLTEAVREIARINLSTVSTVGAIAGALAQLSAAANMPHGAARQVDRLGKALAGLQMPPQALRIVFMLREIAKAGEALKGVRFPNWAPQAEKNATAVANLTQKMRGLENTFSATYQAGSLFRTLFSTITLGTFVQSVMDATNSVTAFKTIMESIGAESGKIADPVAFAGEQFDFIREAADRLGISMNVAMAEFPKLSAAMMLSGRTADEAQMVFESFGGAMRVMGVSADRQRLVFLALQQMFSKGTVNAQELRQQLGEQLPAAFSLMERAIEKSTGKQINLSKELEQGRISANAVLLLAREMSGIYGSKLPQALQTSTAQLTLLNNQWTQFLIDVGQGGVDAALADAFRSIRENLADPTVQQAVKDLAIGMAEVIKVLGDGAAWAVKNVELIAAAVKGLIAVQLINGLRQLAMSVTGVFTALNAGTGGIVGLIGLVAQLSAALVLANEAMVSGVGPIDANSAAMKRLKDINSELNDIMGDAKTASEEQREELVKRAHAAHEAAKQEYYLAAGILERIKAEKAAIAKAAPSFGAFDQSGMASRIQQKDADTRAAQAQLELDAATKAAQEAYKRLEDLQKPVTEAPKIDPFNENGSDTSARKAERERQRRLNEAQTAIKRMTPMAEIAIKTREMEETLKLKEAQTLLNEANIDGVEALQRYKNELLLQSGVLDDASKRALQYKQDVANLDDALARSVITQDQYNLALDATRDKYLDELGAIDPLIKKLNELDRKRKAISLDPNITPTQKAQAQDRLNRDSRRSNGTQDTADRIKDLKDRLGAINNMGDGSSEEGMRSARRQAANDFLRDLDPNGDIKAQQEMLLSLGKAGDLSGQQVQEGLFKMQSAFMALRAEGENGTWIDQFQSRLFDFAASIKPLGVEIGNLFADIASGSISQIGDAFADALTGAKSFRESLYEIANGALKAVISGLVQIAIRALILKALSNFKWFKDMMGKDKGSSGGGGGGAGMIADPKDTAVAVAAQLAGIAAVTAAQLGAISLVTGATVASQAAIAAAAAPAAYFVSLATSGGNAVAASAAVSAFTAAFTAASTVASTAGAVSNVAQGAAGAASAMGALNAATGGLVTGPGTGTSDSIPARLSNGEFVVNAAATKTALPFLKALNENGELPVVYGGGGGGNSAVVQNNVTINVSGGDEDTGEQISRQLIPQLEAMTRRVLANEMRPGGMLRRAS